MKKVFLLITTLFLLFVTENIFAQSNFGRPIVPRSKHQSKNLKRFHNGKRHKRFIPFNKSSRVNHPSVKKDSRRNLRRKYREDKMTMRNY